MKRRQVESGRLPMVGYDTPKEAVSVQLHHDLQSKARFATESLSGSRIESYQLSDDHLFLSLSNDRVMHLFVQDLNIGWSIHEAQDVPTLELQPAEPDQEFLWQDGEISEWHPYALLNSRMRFPISRIFAGTYFVNIYFSKGGSIIFLPRWLVEAEKFMVVFEELEPISAPK
jgi:hypothetical protein